MTDFPERHRRSEKYAALDAERQAAAREEALRQQQEAERAAPPESRVQYPYVGNAARGDSHFGEAQREWSQGSQPLQTASYQATESSTGVGWGWSAGYQPVQTGPQNYRTQAAPPPRPLPPAVARKKRGMRVPLRILLIVLALALLAAAGYSGLKAWRNYQREQEVHRAVTPYDTLFCPNTFVDGIALGGMTQEEARAAVTAQSQSSTGSWFVKLTLDGETLQELRASDLGVQVDIEAALAKAWQQGHTGTEEQRLAAMEQLQETPFEAYSTNPGSDTSHLDGILNSLAVRLYREPRNAVMTSFDSMATYPFSFEPEVIGRMLETASLKEQIYHRLSSMESGEIALQPTIIQPDITVDYLKENAYALRGTGTTPISTSSDEYRTANIRLAFEYISGTVIQPGKSFSFNGVVGQRTEKRGFKPAPEYVYNEVTPGIGGGVCQASTTVYQAAVRANLQIDKREPHSMAVNYTPYGKDATVYWFSNHKIDLVFTNNTDYPIYITAAVQSDPKNRKRLVCSVKIYGQGLNGSTYDFVTEETVIPAPTEPEVIRDKNRRYVTYKDQEYETRKAADGMSVTSYRVQYEKGKEIGREFLFTDIYEAKSRQVYVGILDRPEE